jgi:hypothetical protein
MIARPDPPQGRRRNRTWYLIAEISVYGRPTSCNPSLPRKREPRAAFGVLALGARFRGHDETLGAVKPAGRLQSVDG